jgi:peptidoglycan/xylan/chitin deacetylase (PgdA/CDA1 family)
MERREPAWWDSVADALERTRVPSLEWQGATGLVRMPLTTRAERVRALRAVLPDFRLETGLRAKRIAAMRVALAVSEPARCELMTWKEAVALRDAGMEIGAHTLSHPHLSLLDPARLREEIVGSVEIISQRLGLRPAGLAYPGGDFDARTVEAAATAGLAYAVTTRPGCNRRGSHRFELRRRGFPEGACLGPGGRFSPRLAMAELDGAFDWVRGVLARGAQ